MEAIAAGGASPLSGTRLGLCGSVTGLMSTFCCLFSPVCRLLPVSRLCVIRWGCGLDLDVAPVCVVLPCLPEFAGSWAS